MRWRNLWQHTLVRALLISLVALVAWIALLGSNWAALQAVGIRTDLWAMIEALSTAAGAALVLGAGYIAYRELAEVAETRRMEVADRLFNELNSDECIAARRWVYQHLPADPAEGMRTMGLEGFLAVKRVLNSLDRVAFLQPSWQHDEMVMPWLSTMAVKAWHKLAPYVEYERRRRNEPDYHQTAERLARRCIAWRQENGLSIQPTWVDEAL